ncbi:MAG TPA: hypothetical protein VGQ65_17130 [Thermoanaerobaculia bacterium]|nr:hypothetical protein [Thermoanaerobaculia bacterium]
MDAASSELPIRIVNAAENGAAAKNWFVLGERIGDLALAEDAAILVLLDEPKILFEGADKMSQGLQVALDEIRRRGWACSWYAVQDPSTDLQAQAYQRMAEWLSRGVPLSRDLLAFCAIGDSASPDEHALDVMASKGDWNNRFGQVRVIASRAILATIYDALVSSDLAGRALAAISVRADQLKPSELAPGRAGWGDNKQTLEGWGKARTTEAALLHLWLDGRLPESANRRLEAMLDRAPALAFTVGLFARDNGIGSDRRSKFRKTRAAMRRYEDLLRSCRNRLAHPKDAAPGTYQLVGAVLVAAEAWSAGVSCSLDSNMHFPDEWSHWEAWTDIHIQKAKSAINVGSRVTKGNAVDAIASLRQGSTVDVERATRAFFDVGGGMATLCRKEIERLVNDCFSVTAQTW